MSGTMTVDEILDFAIEQEQGAVDLYTGLAETAKNSGMKKAFLEYANEEQGHKAKLEEVKSGKRFLSSDSKVLDLKIDTYTVAQELGPDADYQATLLFAMKKEKAAFKLYTDLAAKTDDASIQDLLLGLAQEEAKHKLRFELEYDDNVLAEN